MKKISIQTSVFVILLFVGLVPVFAQGPPPGGRPGGFDPDEMIKREKQNVLKALTDLTDDQKLLLEGIYDEYSTSFKELRDDMMQTRDFQAMRSKMEGLQKEKDGLIKDVLNEDQFLIYQGIMDNRRQQMRGRRQRQDSQGNQPADMPIPADSTSAPGQKK